MGRGCSPHRVWAAGAVLSLLLVSTMARAEETDTRPHVALGLLGASGQTWAQAAGGISATRDGAGPGASRWRWRASAQGVYTPRSGSAGGEVVAGAYIGPARTHLSSQHGPELFYNGYGSPTAPDYYLHRTLGLALHNALLLELSDAVEARAWVDPGWVHSDARWADLWLIQELNTGAAADLHTSRLTLTLAGQLEWNYSGMQRQLLLSVSMPLQGRS